VTQTAQQFEDAISEGIKLFMQKGYVNMSIDDIVTVTGLNRYAIYSAFGTKSDFFRACVRQYCATSLSQLEKMVEDPALSPSEIARLNLYSAAEEMCKLGAGCLVCENLTEMSKFTPELTQFCRDYYSTKENILVSVFARARQSGALPKDVEPGEAAAAFMIFKFGLSSEVKRATDVSLLKQKIDAFISAMFRN
jgi:AcrR family transcriptional regulator